jgi:hypothetical protein
MKLGAERKKLAWLIGLVVVAAIVYWMNSSSDAPASTSAGARPALDPTAMAQAGSPKAVQRRVVSGRPTIKPFDPIQGDPVDPSKVDPTIRLDLLAKVQSIQVDNGTHRNVFKTEAPPPDPVLTVSNAPGGKIPTTGKIDLHPPAPVPPQASTQVTTATPPPPGAPPISLKYYGYSTKPSDGEKKAFFLDGDEIIVAAEGEIIKKKYKVVRININANSVQMEDTTSKSTQTLPLQEVAPA